MDLLISFDYHIHYSYNEKLNEFKLTNIEFKDPPLINKTYKKPSKLEGFFILLFSIINPIYVH